MVKPIVFIDSEIGVEKQEILDLGAVKYNSGTFHSPSLRDFGNYVSGCDYVCGHNIIRHDLAYLRPKIPALQKMIPIDTLFWSPLLFPQKPYHALLKDDKLRSDELNNPLNDAEKAKKLFHDEENAFHALGGTMKQIFYGLLSNRIEFNGLFAYLSYRPLLFSLPRAIRKEFGGRICENADLDVLIKHYPVELAYALALIGTNDYHSVTPPWVLRNYPKIQNVILFLRNTPCADGCDYCRGKLDIFKGLKSFFGYDAFRTYNGEPLQEKAAQAAVEGKSLLAVFPTGGGKSITFQLPALMAGQSAHGLTVVISPLQSLMKDQVDNLNERGLVDAVTVNGQIGRAHV